MKKLLVSLLPIAIVLCLFSVANAADTNSSTLPHGLEPFKNLLQAL